MADMSLVMTFLNREGSKTSITVPAVKDDVTDAEVATAMDAIIVKNIFFSAGGDLLTKHSAQLTEKNVISLEVR
jgi:hypothetical protein